MSIVNKIENISSHLENAYNSLEDIGADLSHINKNIENLSIVLDTVYDSMPKISEEGPNLILNNTRKGKMSNVLRGNINQVIILGKNYFNPIVNTFSDRGVTITVDTNQKINFNGTSSSAGAYKMADASIPSGTYTFSLEELSGTHTSSKNIWFDFYNGSTKVESGSLKTTGSFTKTFDTNITSINLGFDFSDAFSNYAFRVQIESGSTATNWEPFTNNVPSPNPDYPQDVDVVSGDNSIKVEGKNLFNPSSPNSLYGNTTLTTITDGIRATATNGGNWKLNVCNVGTTESLNGKTIRFKAKISNSSTNVGAYFVGYCDSNGNNRERVSDIATSEQIVSMTIDNTAKTNVFLCLITQNSATSIGARTYTDFINPILTINNDDMAYEPYESQTYSINLGTMKLCKIGDYQDYIYKENNKWYKHSEVGKQILNGSENWSYSPSNVVFYTDVIRDLAIPNTIYYCNRFFRVDTATTYANMKNGETKYDSSTVTRLIIKMTDYTTSNGFKNWLSTHNTTVYYVLATPTNTEITDQTLIAQLDNFEKAKSYDSQTNISQENNDLPFIINATALMGNSD